MDLRHHVAAIVLTAIALGILAVVFVITRAAATRRQRNLRDHQRVVAVASILANLKVRPLVESIERQLQSVTTADPTRIHLMIATTNLPVAVIALDRLNDEVVVICGDEALRQQLQEGYLLRANRPMQVRFTVSKRRRNG